ncbi:type II toxin-antitoxin system RelE/ParE family toxin [Microbacterium sp. NPDC087665]|uniref:type II toxin-antitoxin system RelE/ParE family toxin n=1 Tax=Microbacterium sp. NPDC087665 TaxID=3364194 RepID=UPI0037FA50C0
MWTVDLEQIKTWLIDLDEKSRTQVVAAIELLQEHGPQLGRPIVDGVKSSRHKNMKELRPGSSGKTELRILFAFDPLQQGIFLIAGDKAGEWKSWYSRNIPIADDLYDTHLKKIEERRRREEEVRRGAQRGRRPSSTKNKKKGR